MGYTSPVFQIRKTEPFAEWIDELEDLQGRARIQVRIERLAFGHMTDVKSVGEGVSEVRIHGAWLPCLHQEEGGGISSSFSLEATRAHRSATSGRLNALRAICKGGNHEQDQDDSI